MQCWIQSWIFSTCMLKTFLKEGSNTPLRCTKKEWCTFISIIILNGTCSRSQTTIFFHRAWTSNPNLSRTHDWSTRPHCALQKHDFQNYPFHGHKSAFGFGRSFSLWTFALLIAIATLQDPIGRRLRGSTISNSFPSLPLRRYWYVYIKSIYNI